MKLRNTSFFILALMILAGTPAGAQDVPLRGLQAVYPAAIRSYDSITAMKVPVLQVSESLRNRQIPSLVDNSRNLFWPGIQEQYQFYSCQQYAGPAYTFGYEINRLRNKPGTYWENSYPAHYTWNFMNQGERYVGVNFLQSFDVIRRQGHMTMNDYGFDTATSVLGWTSGYDKYYRGMFNRIRQVYAIEVNNEEGINTLRNYLFDHLDGSSSGGIACFTTSSWSLVSMPLLPAGTPEEGNPVVLAWEQQPVHGLAVVGYNDSIRFDVNHDGLFTRDIDITGDGMVDARDWETGAFILANSYGTWWADTGFVFALYRSFAMNHGEGGIWNNRVYVVEADTAYRPLMTLKVTLSHNNRNKIRILAGVSADTLDQMPAHTIDFPIVNFQGGAHPMQGYDTIPGADTLETGLDVTELLNYIPSGGPARFFVLVEERDPDHLGHGMIRKASFITYHDLPEEFPVKAEEILLGDNRTTMASVLVPVQKPSVSIVTATLPPYQPGVPYQVQLQAAGGQPPYDWSILEEYVKKPVNTPEPLIGGPSLYIHSEVKSYVAVALPFSFPFYGKRYDSVYINYYGFVAFEPQGLPSPYTTDETAMLRMFPVIAPAFSQQYAYMFNEGDGIWFSPDATYVVIRWKVSVTPYYTGSDNDFAVILFPDGRFEICYGNMENEGFMHTFYLGVSKGDELNFDIRTQWDANEMAGKSFSYYPPVIPANLNLGKAGLLSVSEADSTVIYDLPLRVADMGRITGSKVLMLTGGLEMVHELICGSDSRLKSGENASLKLVVTNTATWPTGNLTLYLRSKDTAILVADSLHDIPSLNPGQSVTIPEAFLFRISGALPNGYPVRMSLFAQSGVHSRNKELLFPVVAPELVMETPRVADGFNERLDPGETAGLVISIQNKGALDANQMELRLVTYDTVVTILTSPVLAINQLKAKNAYEFNFQLKASRQARPGSYAHMEVILSDSAGNTETRPFNLQIGTKPVALANLAGTRTSFNQMKKALDSLNVAYDTLFSLPFDYGKYESIFLILGTANSGNYVLNDVESDALAGYLRLGGKLYFESYWAWYYQNETSLIPMFQTSSKKVPAYFYPDIKGLTGTFTDTMWYAYTAPVNYAVFTMEPVEPAYPTFVSTSVPPRNLEVVYSGDTYRTIGTMVEFGSFVPVQPPSSLTELMKRYLEFFGLNITGPFPLFHAQSTLVCTGNAVKFTDDSFYIITSRSWEFPGGTPPASSDPEPVIRYDNPGLYDVKLTVSDGIHSMEIHKKSYIRAEQCTGMKTYPGTPMVRVFPNPAGDEVTIETDRELNGRCAVTLYNLMGKQVRKYDINPNGNRIHVNISTLPAGIYFLNFYSKDGVSTCKVMKR